MKALSIRQPWAWLIMHGGKNVENRVWNYVPKITGRIWIHAAKGMTVDEYETAEVYAERAWAAGGEKGVIIPSFQSMELGGIIGSAEITGYIFNKPDKMNDYPWYTGDLGIILANPEPCEFRPLRGMLGFFNVP